MVKHQYGYLKFTLNFKTMGLFDKFKSKKESEENRKKRLMAILSDLKCNPYDYEHEKMESQEISLEEELNGAIKSSDLTFENGEMEFDYLSLIDNKDGTKLLYMAINNRDPRETKKLVDKYSTRLGEDFVFLNEFNSQDLQDLKHESNGHLRSWYLTYFDVTIGFSNNEYGTSTYVLSKEKN